MDTMDKILIELYVPSINENYDVFIPTSRRIYEVENMLSKMIEELSLNRYSNNENILCYFEDGKIINRNLRVIDCKITNGTKLMLI